MPHASMRIRKLRAAAPGWLLRDPGAIPILVLVGILLTSIALAADVHQNFREIFLGLPADAPLFESFLLPFGRRHLIILFISLMPAFFVHIYRNREKSLVGSFILVSLALIAGWLPGEILYSYPLLREGPIGEEPAVLAFIGKLILVFLFLASPPVLAWIYHRMSTFNRHVLHSFLTPFSICLAAFIAIWLIMDLSDNGPDFAEGHSNFMEILSFYLVQAPQIILLVLPVTMLLSLLYTLGKMSTSNELVSMSGVGRSMSQIFAPLFGVGLYATFVCIVLNYEWVPWSEGHKESVLTKVRYGYEDKTLADSHLHHNDIDHRTWFIRTIPYDMLNDVMRIIEIREHDESGMIKRTYYAGSARWKRDTNTWTFNKGAIYHYNDDGVPIKIETLDRFKKTDWSETPFKLVSSSFDPEFLGIPGLTSFLKTNSDHEEAQLAPFRAHWHYRWALPWNCFVVTLLAAPLGIVYSRRGILGSVAGAVSIFFAMMFLEHFFLSLGLGGYLPPFLSAWLNNLLFASVGGFLFYLRARNRNFPSFKNLFASRTPAT